MTDAQFASATQRLRTNGIDLTGPAGQLTKDGITASYAFAAGLLRIEVLDRPTLLPLSLIESKLRTYLEQSIAYDAARSPAPSLGETTR